MNDKLKERTRILNKISLKFDTLGTQINHIYDLINYDQKLVNIILNHVANNTNNAVELKNKIDNNKDLNDLLVVLRQDKELIKNAFDKFNDAD